MSLDVPDGLLQDWVVPTHREPICDLCGEIPTRTATITVDGKTRIAQRCMDHMEDLLALTRAPGSVRVERILRDSRYQLD